MRVTDITQGRRNLFSVFIDGEFAFSAYEEILYLHNLRPGEEISCAALAAAQDEQQKLHAKNRALEILSYGDQSEKTLYTKLVRGGVNQRYAAGAVAYAAQRGVDMIVTDHHECREALPEAEAVVDPKQPDSSSSSQTAPPAGDSEVTPPPVSSDTTAPSGDAGAGGETGGGGTPEG